MQHENQRIESVSRFFCESAKLLGLLVDLIGIEPMTSSMPWKRAPSCATGPLTQGCNSPIVSAAPRFVKRGQLDPSLGGRMAKPRPIQIHPMQSRHAHQLQSTRTPHTLAARRNQQLPPPTQYGIHN